GSALRIDAAFPGSAKVFRIQFLFQGKEEVRLSQVHAVVTIVWGKVRGRLKVVDCAPVAFGSEFAQGGKAAVEFWEVRGLHRGRDRCRDRLCASGEQTNDDHGKSCDPHP